MKEAIAETVQVSKTDQQLMTEYFAGTLPVTMRFAAKDTVADDILKIARETYDNMYFKIRADVSFQNWLPIFLRGFVKGSIANLAISSAKEAIDYIDLEPLHKWDKEPYALSRLWPEEMSKEFLEATTAYQNGVVTDGEILLVIDRRNRQDKKIIGITGWYTVNSAPHRHDFGLRFTAIYPEYQQCGYGLGTITALLDRLILKQGGPKPYHYKDDVVLHQLCDRDETFERFTKLGFDRYEDSLAKKVREAGGDMKYVMLTNQFRNNMAWCKRNPPKAPSIP